MSLIKFARKWLYTPWLTTPTAALMALAAGLMMFLGAELIYHWAFAARRKLPQGEWLIVLAILASSAVLGFLYGLMPFAGCPMSFCAPRSSTPVTGSNPAPISRKPTLPCCSRGASPTRARNYAKTMKPYGCN